MRSVTPLPPLSGDESPAKKEFISVLWKLVHMYSPSGLELDVMRECAWYLATRCKFTVTIDDVGNVMAVRGDAEKYPLLNAHGDTVQNTRDENLIGRIVYDINEDLIHGRGDVMIGGDDKAGIAIILTLARYTSCPMKVLLTVGEEIGSKGMQAVDPTFYDDVGWCITLDRKGGYDIIDEYCGRLMAPREFTDMVILISERCEHPMEVQFGSFADTYHASYYCPSINMSAGYHGAHSSEDCVDVTEAMQIMSVVQQCVTTYADDLTAIAVDYRVPPPDDDDGRIWPMATIMDWLRVDDPTEYPTRSEIEYYPSPEEEEEVEGEWDGTDWGAADYGDNHPDDDTFEKAWSQYLRGEKARESVNR